MIKLYNNSEISVLKQNLLERHRVSSVDDFILQLLKDRISLIIDDEMNENQMSGSNNGNDVNNINEHEKHLQMILDLIISAHIVNLYNSDSKIFKLILKPKYSKFRNVDFIVDFIRKFNSIGPEINVIVVKNQTLKDAVEKKCAIFISFNDSMYATEKNKNYIIKNYNTKEAISKEFLILKYIYSYRNDLVMIPKKLENTYLEMSYQPFNLKEIFEYLEGYDPSLKNPILMRLMLQCLEKLADINKLGFVHLNLKPENIFITKKMEVRFSSFEKSVLLGVDIKQISYSSSDLRYLPIECSNRLSYKYNGIEILNLSKQRITYSSDVFSISSIFMEQFFGMKDAHIMFIGDLPTIVRNESETIDFFTEEQIEAIGISPMLNFIRFTLHTQSLIRYTAEEAIFCLKEQIQKTHTGFSVSDLSANMNFFPFTPYSLITKEAEMKIAEKFYSQYSTIEIGTEPAKRVDYTGSYNYMINMMLLSKEDEDLFSSEEFEYFFSGGRVPQNFNSGIFEYNRFNTNPVPFDEFFKSFIALELYRGKYSHMIIQHTAEDMYEIVKNVVKRGAPKKVTLGEILSELIDMKKDIIFEGKSQTGRWIQNYY